MAVLLVITLVAQAILFCFTAVSWLAPAQRVWPPPSRESWQFRATWFLSWVSLSGVFLLALFAGNPLGLHPWLRFGLGLPLLGLGALLIGWGFRALSVPTSLGLSGAFIGTGPYRFSRNPQYLGTCLYLASLVLLSGSPLTAVGCLAVGLWFLATPFVEEPWLAAHYGAEYEAYRQTVPRFFGFRHLRATA